MKTYSYKFSVTGRLPFPIDMLRYEGAYPASEQDSAKIISTFQRGNRADEIVELRLWSQQKFWRPTEGRWNSFSWRVIALEEGRAL